MTETANTLTTETISDMEYNLNISSSYLELLHDIISPPQKTNEPDAGLDKFSEQSRWGMIFMIGNISNTLDKMKIIIEESAENRN